MKILPFLWWFISLGIFAIQILAPLMPSETLRFLFIFYLLLPLCHRNVFWSLQRAFYPLFPHCKFALNRYRLPPLQGLIFYLYCFPYQNNLSLILDALNEWFFEYEFLLSVLYHRTRVSFMELRFTRGVSILDIIWVLFRKTVLTFNNSIPNFMKF